MNLQDAINSASSITKTLSGELADGHRQILAIAAAGANSKAVNPLATQLSNGPLAGLHEMVYCLCFVIFARRLTHSLRRIVTYLQQLHIVCEAFSLFPNLRDIFVQQAEAPLDPTKELSRLISERKYEEAFTAALHRSDVSIVSWLCSLVSSLLVFALVCACSNL